MGVFGPAAVCSGGAEKGAGGEGEGGGWRYCERIYWGTWD